MPAPVRYCPHKNTPQLIILVCSCTLFIVIRPAQATDLFDSFQVHGFASQAYILTSGNNFLGDSRGDGSFEFRELGLNASLNPLPKLQLSAQLLSRARDDQNLRLGYGIIDYSLLSNETNRLGFRLGRLKNPYGLYNETRDAPFTRPGILLPQSIYFERTRNLALTLDGGGLYGMHSGNFGSLSWEFNFGDVQIKDLETELALLGRDWPGNLGIDTSYIGRIMYESVRSGVKLALTRVQLNQYYEPALSPPADLGAGTKQFEPTILSVQYNAEHWSITSEYALRHFDAKGFGTALDTSFTGESYYLQGIYRFNPKWSGILRYDVLYVNKDDPTGESYVAITGRPAHKRFAKDWTIGLSWNITPQLMLRSEYHRINGTGWLTLTDNPDLAAAEQYWNLFGLMVAYQF